MPRFFGSLPVAGDGSEENPYHPDVPKGVAGIIDDYVDWGAWYYPQNAPYQYCIITAYKIKKTLPPAVKKLELTLSDIQTNYPECYQSLTRSGQNYADPAPESWNFDSDTVCTTPSGWTLLGGTMCVQSDQYVSSPNSYKGTVVGVAHAKAGASRTDLMLKAQVRSASYTALHGVAILFRLTDINNYYRLILWCTIAGVRNLSLEKVVGGTATTIATIAYSWSDDTWYELKVEMQGTNARGYVNGVQQIPASGWQDMGTDFSSGVIGVRQGASVLSWFDDVYVEDYAAATYINVSDSGVGSDSLAALQAQLPISDAGLGSDLPSLQAQLSLSDSGIGSDSAVAGFFVDISDSGVGSDMIAQLQASLSVPDSGVGSDVIAALQAQLAILESGIGSDVWTKSEISEFIGIVRSTLSMLERDMEMEQKEIGMTLEQLERKMKMELIE